MRTPRNCLTRRHETCWRKGNNGEVVVSKLKSSRLLSEPLSILYFIKTLQYINSTGPLGSSSEPLAHWAGKLFG
jgi:hypothetical protein